MGTNLLESSMGGFGAQKGLSSSEFRKEEGRTRPPISSHRRDTDDLRQILCLSPWYVVQDPCVTRLTQKTAGTNRIIRPSRRQHDPKDHADGTDQRSVYTRQHDL